MKQKISNIQVNNSHSGRIIQVLRGLTVRKYKYTTERYFAILDNTPAYEWESYRDGMLIVFMRVY